MAHRGIGAVALAVVALVAAGCTGTGGAPGGTGAIRLGHADVLTDERAGITLTGLEPDTPVTLVARRTDTLGRAWVSSATYAVGPGGVVDVDRQAPEAGGTYAGVDGMGPIRSLRLADGESPAPPAPTGSDPAARIALTAVQDGATVATAGLVQRSAAPGVTRTDVRTDGLVGTLHLPPGPGPYPGVVLLSGSEGGIPRYDLAGLLASRGYATFSLAYFGEPGLPPSLDRIPLEYFDRAMTWLRARPEVSDGPVGVVGPSRGGELALLLGATSPQVGAVVSYVGSGLVNGGLPADYSYGAQSAWTRGGRDVPFVFPVAGVGESILRYGVPVVLGEPVRDTAGTPADIRALDPAEVERATIPVERTRGPVLLLSAQADRLWPSPTLSEFAARRLAAAGHPYASIAYPGAGHFFVGSPYGVKLPASLSSQYGRLTGGGDADANARAAADAWPRVLETLREGIGR